MQNDRFIRDRTHFALSIIQLTKKTDEEVSFLLALQSWQVINIASATQAESNEFDP